MIKRLRIKFVAITMTIVTVMLCLLLGSQYRSTRKSLEEASLTALKNAADSHFTMGPHDFFQRHNNAPCFMLGLTPWDELIVAGSSYYDLSDEEALRVIHDAAAAAHAEYGVLEEYNLRFYRVPFHDDYDYYFTDISGEARTLNRLLTDSIFIGIVGFFSFLAVSMSLAKWAVKPVETAWQQQRQFVADASHELKTPLTVILTNGEMLLEESYSPAQRQQFASNILTMSHQMQGLVERMLQLARVDSGQLQANFETLDLSKLVSDAILPFDPMFFEQGLPLETRIQPDIQVKGSETGLKQVVEILLDNCLKYTAPGGTVRLALTTQNHHCLLTVSSPGQAMTPQQCRDIFKRFYRVDQARSMNRSYGLGLAIAQEIVSGHRGRIWAVSHEGVNTFCVLLPL